MSSHLNLSEEHFKIFRANYLLNSSELLDTQLPSRLGSALGAITAFLFIIFGILGDSLIIIAILSKKELRNNLINIFIVSLQLNDIFNIGYNQFLVGLFYIIRSKEWSGPYIFCEILVYTSIICTGSLLWHHALISIHRYLVVVCNLNLKYFGVSPKFYIIVSIIIARLIPTLVCAPAIINRNMTVYSPTALRCMLAPNVSGFQNLLIVLVNMLIPCVIVIVCFAYIFARVHTVSKNIRKPASTLKHNSKQQQQQQNGHSIGESKKNNSSSVKSSVIEKTISSDLNGPKKEVISRNNSNSLHGRIGSTYGHSNANTNLSTGTANGNSLLCSKSSMHREIQITKMFAIIFTVFLFGYLPYGIIRLIDAKNSLHPDVYVLLTVLFIISISISPIIYGLMNTQIRNQCVLLLRKLFGCQDLPKTKTDLNVTNLRATKVSGITPQLIKSTYNTNDKTYATRKIIYAQCDKELTEIVENENLISKCADDGGGNDDNDGISEASNKNKSVIKEAASSDDLEELNNSNSAVVKKLSATNKKSNKNFDSATHSSSHSSINKIEENHLLKQLANTNFIKNFNTNSLLNKKRKEADSMPSQSQYQLNSSTNKLNSMDSFVKPKITLDDDGGVYKGPP